MSKQVEVSFYGDIHGEVHRYTNFTEKCGSDYTFQVGDIGVCFPDVTMPVFKQRHKFILGNHDEHASVEDHPNYLGRFGYVKELDLFYVSGAWSPDWKRRTPGKDYWPSEQLSEPEWQECFDLYRWAKPSVMLTHSIPQFIAAEMGFGRPTDTKLALDHMFKLHQPAYWVAGHFHKTYSRKMWDTWFYIVDSHTSLTLGLNKYETRI